MSQGKPNYVARVLAVLALFAAFVAVIATIATSGDDGDGDGDSKTTAEQTGITKEGEKALEDGVWVVREGDTVGAIAEATGIDLDELVALNPDIDPQALIPGQRISLRPGQAGGGNEESSTTDASDSTETNGDPADEFGDGSVDGDNSSSSDGVTSP